MRQSKGQILSGEIPAGASLPSLRKLAHELLVSVITPKRAYEELERKGLVPTVGGKGTFAASQNQEFRWESRKEVVEGKRAEGLTEARTPGLSEEGLLDTSGSAGTVAVILVGVVRVYGASPSPSQRRFEEREFGAPRGQHLPPALRVARRFRQRPPGRSEKKEARRLTSSV